MTLKSETPDDSPVLGRPSTLKNPKETILKAATGLFAQRGYAGTSLQDIATGVKMTKAGLYHYFPTKHDILDQIVLKLLSDMHDDVFGKVQAETDPVLRLRTFMSAHAAFFGANQAAFQTAFDGKNGVEGGYTGEQLAARQLYEEKLINLLEEGVKAEAFQMDDIPNNARGILGMLNWMSRWYRSDGEKNAGEIGEGFFEILHNGLKPRGHRD